jgi:hypothetical protein
MKTKRLMRWKERETLEILDRTLRGTSCRVFSKVRLNDVLGAESGENLSREDRNFLMTAHFDFVIYDRRGYWNPMFAVEFDGPHHQEPVQIRRDIRKNRLCMRAKLPLLRIGYSELGQHDQLTLLEFMLQRFVAWQQERGKLLAQIQSYVSTLDEEEFKHLTEGGILDPSTDPSFLFDLKHPFPGILKVARRLLARFGILTTRFPVTMAAKLKLGDKPLRCETMHAGTDYSDSHQVTQTFGYALYRHDPDVTHFRWVQGKLEVPGLEVLCEGSVKFSMRWTLPVAEDYDSDESGFDYFVRKGEMPYVFSDLPGVHIPDIAEWFSEYLALREVEKWAELNLSQPQRCL